MGLPIVLGVRGFAKEFVAQAGCGVSIEPGSASQLVEAVLELAENAELRARLGASGQRYVIERFDRDLLAERYLLIIERFRRGNSASVRSLARGAT